MDSLRDKHFKAPSSIPARDGAPVAVQDGTGEINPLDVDIVPLPLPNDPAAAQRFSSTFRDPHFPYKAPSYEISKRAFDILMASLALLLSSPITLVVALLIKLTDRGPVFFKQVRVGRGGRYFWCYKFRSMCVDAEEKKKQLMHLNEVSGPVFKMKRDPRVTKVGAVIRKLSIDEFPQFFNVLIGDMSIVGPRPPLPSEVSLYNAHERGRLAVVPGITCIWQVSGRSDVSFEKWVELDLEYIETMSLATDIRILLQTVPAVLKGSGAR
jgi:exopolysaccharide biosynthesis polyprenyl glycosylphosphotransferase